MRIGPSEETSERLLARATAPDVDPFTAMIPRFGGGARLFAERFFAGFRLNPREAKLLKELEGQGAVVYVMRYSSRLDYLLFNWLFLREGLRLATRVR